MKKGYIPSYHWHHFFLEALEVQQLWIHASSSWFWLREKRFLGRKTKAFRYPHLSMVKFDLFISSCGLPLSISDWPIGTMPILIFAVPWSEVEPFTIPGGLVSRWVKSIEIKINSYLQIILKRSKALLKP